METTIKDDIVSLTLRAFASLLGVTWRYKVFKMAEFNDPAILVIWHKHILPMAFFYKNREVSCIASGSKDGRRLAAILQRWKFKTILGSSGHGGKAALRGGLRELNKYKNSLIVTPDGPTGPREELKPGILFFAQKSNCDTVVITFKISSYWRLKTWDRLIIPKPFAKIEMLYEKISESSDIGENYLKKVRDKLNA